jgi:nicotinamide mononucleotide adenylyltransferase/PAS domain-containing protein
MFLDLKQEIQSILEEQNTYKKVVALYGGGFKPPTKGHYAVVEKALKQNPEVDEMIIYIGNAERDGVTQDQSEKIWNIYAKYLPYKVKFEKVASPIRSIFDYAKNNPDEKIIWVIGAREGNEEDFNDIATRTKNASLRPNIQVETIITANQVSGTAARNAVSSTLEKFRIFLPDFIKDDEAEEIFALLKTGELVSENLQDRKDTPNLYNLARKYNVGLYKIITNLLKGAKIEMANVEDEEMAMNQSFNMISKDLDYYDGNLDEELESGGNAILKYIAPLTKFMESEGLVFKPYPKIKLIKDDVENGEKVLGNTAHFDPNNNVIVLYTYKRHPKDILRSYAHELIHVYQNVEDRLNGMSNTTNVNEDDYLEKLEREAYEKGNILFRKWTNSLDKKQGLNEIGDASIKPLSYKEVHQKHNYNGDGNVTIFNFTTPKGLEYEVEIDNYGGGLSLADVNFKVKGGRFSDETNQGEMFVIMSTVIKIVKDFLSKNDNIINVEIAASKKDTNDSRRFRIYQAYVKQHLPQGWGMDTTDTGGDIIHLIKQNSINESTDVDFQNLEKVLDDMFADVDIDVNFTRHFRERVTQRKLTQEDIIDLMQKIHDKYGEDLADLPKNSNRVFTHLTKLIDIASGIGGWNADGLKNLDLITAFKRDHVSQPEFRTNAQSPKLKVNEVIVGEKIECDNCGWSWDIKDGGDDLFICHKCGHDNTPLQESKTKDPFGLNAYTMELARLAEGEEGYKIYVDMDGVIADFDLRFKQVTGLTPDEFESKHGLEKFWEVIDIDNKVKFWVGIPLMNGAKDLIDYVKNYDYELLTAPSRQKSSMLGKRLWVKKHVGSLFPSTPKINFRQAENKPKIKKELTNQDILIDDKKSTIDSWNSKGGTGILYVSSNQTIEQLKKLGL